MARRYRGMRCSFCEKDQNQARRLICGPNWVAICDECIRLCNDILAKEPPSQAPFGVVAYGTIEDAPAPRWRRRLARWLPGRHHSSALPSPAGGALS